MTEAKLAPNLPGWMLEHTKLYLSSGGTEGHMYKMALPGRPEITVPSLLLTTTGRRSASFELPIAISPVESTVSPSNFTLPPPKFSPTEPAGRPLSAESSAWAGRSAQAGAPCLPEAWARCLPEAGGRGARHAGAWLPN